MNNMHIYPRLIRIFMDVGGHDYWHTQNLFELRDAMIANPSPYAVIVSNQDDADCILRIGGCPSLLDGLKSLKWPVKKSPPEFVWDMSDLPSGILPGFYASLPDYMYNKKRHRGFCLPFIMNEQIEPYEFGDASFLFGYFDSTSSGLRQRLNPILKESHDNNIALVEVRDGIWNKMFDRSGLQEKIDYAENLRRCRFIICPKGAVLAGAGSRLYETMQAARVPVIISDRITLPEGIDWKSCSIRIRERDVKKIPLILKSYDGQWPELARNAREVYVKHFSREAILGEIGRQLDELLAENDKESSLTYIDGVFRIMLGKLALWARRSLGKIRKFI